MIASALRADIERFASRVSGETVHVEPLARCAAALQRLTRGMRAGGSGTEELLPSMRALAALVERSAKEEPAAYHAYCALAEHLAARLGTADADPDRIEAKLDAIDDLVEDPRQLPILRERLRLFIERFELLCQETSRASDFDAAIPRRRADATASVA